MQLLGCFGGVKVLWMVAKPLLCGLNDVEFSECCYSVVRVTF